jgi:hypothetical protein
MTLRIRSRTDCRIGFDTYRTRTTALRGQAAREGAVLRTAAAGALVMAGALGFAFVIPTSSAMDRIAAAVAGQLPTH